MSAEVVNGRESSQRLLTRLQSLQDLAAQHSWRGLLLLQAPSSVIFQWPQGALVLSSDLNQYRHHLGTNQSLLVLDLRSSLHGDALAACLPTLSGGGLAVVILPLNLSPFAQRLCATLPTPYAHHMFLRDSEATSCLPQSSKCSNTTPRDEAGKMPGDEAGKMRGVDAGKVSGKVQSDVPDKVPSDVPADLPAEAPHQTIDIRQLGVPEPTHVAVACAAQLNEQQSAVLNQLHQHIAQNIEAPALINAPRGRGKSTVLGIFAAHMIDAGYRVTVCAPSRRQLQSLQSSAARPLPFIAPDALVARDAQADIIILDEAASLPQHMLDALLKRYPRLIMATTSEGYETCGRGFLLRFQHRLAEQFAEFLSCTLQDPVRFAPHCPIESWLHQVLLLSPVVRGTVLPQMAPETLSYHSSHAAQLTEADLQACFYLLMDAHYQTSPNDLKLLLDDPNHRLVLQIAHHNEKAHIVGVTWLCAEGELDSELAHAVVAGTRRPAGNLIAQGLAYYFQSTDAARAPWLRIIRVAVLPSLQNQGLGSDIIDYVTALASRELAGIGTSFASTATINRFWRRAGFLPVRIGARKDPATGCHALMMLHPVSPLWRDKIHRWAAYCDAESQAAETIYGLPSEYFTALQPIPGPLPDPLPVAARSDYLLWAKHRLRMFVERRLDISAVRLTMANLLADELAHDAILRCVVLDRTIPDSLLDKFDLRGRKDAVEYVRSVCFKWLRAI